MNISKKAFFGVSFLSSVMVIFVLTSFASMDVALAANTPKLTLVTSSSSVNIAVTGADHNATVMFSYPNTSVSNSSSVTYTSIDIGKTDNSGSFNVSVASNSYGLGGGVSVYVSVDGAKSSNATWPVSADATSQAGSLSLSQQSIALTIGQSISVYPMNTANTLSIQSNSKSTVASAYVQQSNNSVSVTGLNAGSSLISICASIVGCGTVSVTVTAPTQKVTFSQSPIYVVVGHAPQSFGIYGSGTYYGLTNTDKNAISASISGTDLLLQGLTTGQSTVTVCADGYRCGSVTVNSVSPGSVIPAETKSFPPIYSNFDQPPQLSSFNISSNNVRGQFFGLGSTISINFSTNVTVKNVQVKIAGIQTVVTQGSSGAYYVSYKSTGNESLPLAVVASFVDLSGRAGQSYFWIGDSGVDAPTSAKVTSLASSTVPVSKPAVSSIFNHYLYSGMTAYGVSDPEVVKLQQRLKTEGLFAGAVTGYFGPQTKTAIEAYQKKHGLEVVGVVGPSTRTLLNKEI